MVSGDFRDSDFRRIGTLKRRTSLVQSSQQEVSRRAYAEEIDAICSKAALRHADLFTKGGDFEFFNEAFAKAPFEPRHYDFVALACLQMVVCLIGGKAINDCMKQFLLQRRCSPRSLDKFRFGLCKTARFAEETLKS